jgi:uncharacterized membrane protein
MSERFTGARLWLGFALVTTLFWGVWGALIELPDKAGFPATLGYAVWSLTMLPVSAVVLHMAKWKLELDARSILLGSAVGFLGAGGQLVLFQALRMGPAYLVFPIISLYPVLTVALSVMLLKERASRKAWVGIVLALPAIAILNQSSGGAAGGGRGWVVLAALVFVAWGLQAYVMKFANRTMSSEGIFFYMAITAVLLIPFAIWMTDFSQPINWGFRGPYAAALIQVLNAIGALTLVFALRHGKAIIVVPMTSLAPVLTIILSLALYHTMPGISLVVGMALASIAIYLMAE